MPLHSKKDEVKAKVFELSFMAWKSQCEAMHTIARAWIDTAKKKSKSNSYYRYTSWRYFL